MCGRKDALLRSKETIYGLELLLQHDRVRLAALETQVVGMRMADASVRARYREESELARVRADAMVNVIARAELAEAEARHTQAALDLIHASTTWRILARAASVLAAHPAARRLLREGFYSGLRAVRAVRPPRSL